MTLTMVVVVVGKLVENVLDRVPDVDVDVDRVPDGAELVDSQSSGLELQLADRSVSPLQLFFEVFIHFFEQNLTGSALPGRTSLWRWP